MKVEVEAKVRILKPEKLREKVEELGEFIGKEKKVDEYWTLESFKNYPKKSLRIRKRKGFYEINFKQRISYKDGVHAKKEFEFKVSDINNFMDLIKDFGFRKWLRKEKTTELYRIKDNFHIEINNVKGLGVFLEVEYLTNEKKINKARNEVLKVLKKLEISKNDIVKEGYTKMLWGKKY